ncbi:hypothetical protein BS50DRAFT_572119 [Corynespora cassiicola Philippines]|uniref:C2H2-type domain-containing protein n=1 Tax=Corynespora cassiicola Philippines TaxID=1448308 RepID=A0A2T2NU90_CORCC|nr:hypothetical protein BS50DRAFT_572119 [Corynespora cassiicola Philippines]
MHLASMVHGSGREREAYDRHYHHPQPHHPQQQPHSAFYPAHSQPRAYAVPVTSAPVSYSAPPQAQAPPAEYQYQRHQQQQQHHHQRQHPQSPPSPPVEEQKPSLPSISSLLGIADGEKASSETAGQSPKSQQHSSPQLRHEQQQRAATQPPQQPESRPDQAPHAFGSTIVSNPRMTLPPTPPMHPDPVVDGNQSPSAASNHSAASAPYFLGQSLNNMEPHQQRQSMSSVPPMKRESLPPQASMSPYNASTYAQSPYASSPGGASASSFYSPETHAYGMYSQRPLPSNFQPQGMPLPVPTSSAGAPGVWQHHHYISASSQSAFPQSQDRYICSTCNKAFSRPSSLRIHSHSHTGEKPYKCPQPGCGKAFSVRSNMKRHERGCHASTSATITT